MREDRQKWIRNAGLASSAGLVLATSVFIGYAFGHWLDKVFGTDPWLMLLFTLMGTAAGFIELFRLVQQIIKDE